MLFMAVDILGGIFSFLSLFFRESLDIAGFVSPPSPISFLQFYRRFTNMLT